MAGLHFATSTPGLFKIGQAWNSVRRLKDEIQKEPVLYEGGEIIVPQNRIELGVELDEKKIDKYKVGELWIKK